MPVGVILVYLATGWHKWHMVNMAGNTSINDELAWAAVKRRDRGFDGQFVTGVLSTGIFCRPSCAARHPARANVRFFINGAAARGAGLRACKRCLPDDVTHEGAAVQAVIEEIKASANEGRGQPRLADLAAKAGYSPSHFQRIFKRAAGISPAAYARALREERMRDALSRAGHSRAGLSQEGRVTDAIYDAGFENPSRFYDSMEGKLGMQPSAWRNGGRGVTINWAIITTSLGPMLLAATRKGVCRLSFAEGREELAARFPNADLFEGDAGFSALAKQVIDAVEQPASAPDIPLDVKGTVFQEAVWRELRKIPPGETRSYGQIAAAVGKPKAVRATGSANGANCVAVLIPCHRVVRSDGSLGGYAYGAKIKQKLLEKEKNKGL